MNSKSLTPQQIARLAKTASQIRHWLSCVSGRCHQTHWPYDDPLRIAIEDALATAARLDETIKKINTSEK